ncbi:MAG TPA: dienelactone hydrolase family protein [Blastocatellia bacterium]|nr:dienelactone hydrolase family protein [Blastocatellia bacterium]
MTDSTRLVISREVTIPCDDAFLEGEIKIPLQAKAIVLFAHGSGSSRFSPRNQKVAQMLRNAGLGTLLFDLLTKREEREEEFTGHMRFDINLLGERLVSATRWVSSQAYTRNLRIGYFGASTGAAAALVAAAELPDAVKAVVSRGGRPDLAGKALGHVVAPTLLIVGGNDYVVIELNEQAYARLACEKKLAVIPGATHLFEEPGTLEQVADLAAAWFTSHLQAERAEAAAQAG